MCLSVCMWCEEDNLSEILSAHLFSPLNDRIFHAYMHAYTHKYTKQAFLCLHVCINPYVFWHIFFNKKPEINGLINGLSPSFGRNKGRAGREELDGTAM